VRRKGGHYEDSLAGGILALLTEHGPLVSIELVNLMGRDRKAVSQALCKCMREEQLVITGWKYTKDFAGIMRLYNIYGLPGVHPAADPALRGKSAKSKPSDVKPAPEARPLTPMNGNAGIVLRAIERGPKTTRELVTFTRLNLCTVGGQIAYLTARRLINICGRLPGDAPRAERIKYGIPGRDAPVAFVQEEIHSTKCGKRTCGSGVVAGPAYTRGLCGWGGWGNWR
jgi:hypothetical protein